ncbi:MAG: SPOR domain-containing protein [Phormidesmis sp.]
MVVQQISSDLSPQLSKVLSGLSVNLEAELNRYRRNRRYSSVAEADLLFADLDDPAFDLDTVGSAVEASIAATVAAVKPITPPPLPQNKKLLAQPKTGAATDSLALPASATSSLALADQSDQAWPKLEHSPSAASGLMVQPSAREKVEATGITSTGMPSTGYLTSSEQLIESLADGPSIPEPVDANRKPKRKTVSLLAGASLGFFGLVAGLGASYLMANPLVTQRLASGFGSESQTSLEPVQAFDPPGPDLSANEFIDLELDNLSSLKMPHVAIDPGSAISSETGEAIAPTNTLESGLENPTAAPALPPIEPNAAASGTGHSTRSTAPPPVATQAVVVPVGLTYYVTTPFTTDQGLTTIRETVSEAFVRQFANGTQIQIAAFDNPQAAQALIAELKNKGITAQIYGPTTE